MMVHAAGGKDDYSDALEDALLGAMMLNPSSIDRILKVIGPLSFARLETAFVFRAIELLYENDAMVSVENVARKLSGAGLLGPIGGVQRLIDMIEATPSPEHSLHYAASLLESRRG